MAYFNHGIGILHDALDEQTFRANDRSDDGVRHVQVHRFDNYRRVLQRVDVLLLLTSVSVGVRVRLRGHHGASGSVRHVERARGWKHRRLQAKLVGVRRASRHLRSRLAGRLHLKWRVPCIYSRNRYYCSLVLDERSTALPEGSGSAAGVDRRV